MTEHAASAADLLGTDGFGPANLPYGSCRGVAGNETGWLAARLGDQRVGALQQHHGARAGRGQPDGLEPVVRDPARLDLEQPLAEVARRGSPGRLRPGLTLLQVRLRRTQTLLLLHLGGTLAKGVANCQTFIVIGAPPRGPRTTKTASTGGLPKLRGWDSNPQPIG